MWILEAQRFKSSDERSEAAQTCKHYLAAGSHIVGRQLGQSTVVVEEDKSISRSHALLIVSYGTDERLHVKDTSRYGTLVNRQELNGGERDVHEGDLLQFGHKSVYKVSKWRQSIAVLQQAPSVEQHLSQLGFSMCTEATDASCIIAPAEASFTADLAALCYLGKPVTTVAWLEAWLRRACFKDAPPDVAAYQPHVVPFQAPQLAAKQYSLPQQLSSSLFADQCFLLLPEVLQKHPQLAHVIQPCGGSIVTTKASRPAILVALDEQAAAGVSAPAGSQELCVTTAGRVLGAVLADTTEGMIARKVRCQTPAEAPLTQPSKRKTADEVSPTEASPMRKRRRQSIAPATQAAQRTPDPAVQPEPASAQQPVTKDEPIELEAPAAADGSADPALQSASDAQPVDPAAGVPDNNAISWAPLVVKARLPVSPGMHSSVPVVNFKRFSKVLQQKHGPNALGFAKTGYAESLIVDSEAFLRQQAGKQKQQAKADELFSANIRVQKQAALPPAAVKRAGRGKSKAL